MHILLVEDNRINLEITSEILSQFGCQVSTAENGRQAIEAARANTFDLIFMDCQMPEMDGFEAARHIRQKELAGTTRTPIVALTADAMTGDRDKCIKAGMDDYLNKPFKFEQIAEMLRKWVVPA